MLPYAPWLCWLIPMFGSLVVLLLALLNRRVRDTAPLILMVISLVFSLSMIPDVLAGSVTDVLLGQLSTGLPFDWKVTWVHSLGLEMGVLVDFLSVITVALVSFIGVLVCMFSISYMGEERDLTRYWFLVLLFIGGLGMIVMSDNFLGLFVGWEIVGMSCVALVSFWYEDRTKAHYGLKTFMILRVGDVFLLSAILITYFHSGSFNYLQIASNVGWMSELPTIALIVAVMLLGGALAKSAQFPLHEWLPDAMPATPASFNPITEVLAGVYLVARAFPIFLSGLPNSSGELIIFFSIVAWAGAFSAFYGSILASVQRNLVKVLAYSIMSQYAYMIASLGIAGLMHDPVAGYTGAIFHLVVDAVASGLLFLSAAAVLHRIGSQKMRDMGGLRDHMPVTFVCMAVGAIATIGIPPISGFWSEESIYSAALGLVGESARQGHFILTLSACGVYFLLIATAAVTAFYVIRMMGVVFRRKRKADGPESTVKEVSPIMYAPMILAAAVTVGIGLFGPVIAVGFHKLSAHHLLQAVVDESAVGILDNAFLSQGFVVTCVALIAGAYPAYRIYVSRRVKLGSFRAKHGVLKHAHAFLWNRRYFDSLNYALASWVRKLSDLMYRYPEMNGLDAMNHFVAHGVASLAGIFRKAHTGVLSYDMLAIILGTAVLAVMLLIFGVVAT